MKRNHAAKRREPAAPAPRPDAPSQAQMQAQMQAPTQGGLPGEAAALDDELRAWLQPMAGACPAGPSLEYTHEYAALQARMAAPVEVQYGNFTQRREAAPWPELERECQALLRHSRDITLLVWWLRCRARNAGAPGFEQGLRCLVLVLRGFGEHVHPQAQVDGEHDPAIRANALALLGDADGLVSDLRDLVALRTQGEQHRVRDVERALAGDAAARAAMRALLARGWADANPDLRALGAAHGSFAQLQAWARDDLQGACPDLSLLGGLLEAFAPPAPVAEPDHGRDAVPDEMPDGGRDEAQDEAPDEAPDVTRDPAQDPARDPARDPASRARPGPAAWAAPLAGTEPAAPAPGGRLAAQAGIAQARAWFELHEPSSPVCVLLRQAERLVGKRYAEVVQAIPAELLARWESAP